MTEAASFGFAVRLAGLWAAWLLVMLFHVELGLMPLFHGLSVDRADSKYQQGLASGWRLAITSSAVMS
jgi:hypothetical protein